MKNKIAIFIVGLLAGIAIVVVFDVGIQKILQPVRDLYSSIRKINSTQDKISQRLDSIQGKLKDDKKTAPLASKGFFKTPVIAPVAAIKADSIAAKKKEADDSLGNNIDSSVVFEGRDSNIVVMTNQLVSVKSLPLNTVDSVSKTDKVNRKSDSVIAAMSDVEEERDPHFYRIEFWQSPLNFKGYKMSKGKIILYGLNSNSALRLVKWDDEYYLMSNQIVYKVEYTDDYKPFEKVMDKTVLKKITL